MVVQNKMEQPNMTGYVYKNYVEMTNKSGPNETLQEKPIRQQRAFMAFVTQNFQWNMTSTIQSFTYNEYTKPIILEKYHKFT
jgi:hypothetical protein